MCPHRNLPKWLAVTPDGLRSFEAILRFSPRTVCSPDRKTLAEVAREAVLEVFEPVVDPAERATDSGL